MFVNELTCLFKIKVVLTHYSEYCKEDYLSL